MSGFSAEWLALREAADHAARNRRLEALVEAAFATRPAVSILDLACGAGSNLRALALRLPYRQHWRLIDHDEALLAVARTALSDWADRVESFDPLIVHKADRRLEISFDLADLAVLGSGVFDASLDLVTTAAFIDLVSADWIEKFCDELARLGLPFYAALSYEGVEQWRPEHHADAAMLDAFLKHQMGDKGFGPAAGPRAATLLQQALARHGYVVACGASPWRLGRSEAGLIEALVEGSAQAVIETALVSGETVDDWRRVRRASTACEIHHVDIFAKAPQAV
ncbi:class I SAM-dependent methyltransferase [Methylocystis heyeri]|uniref:SAM-dependent methyltransferase n=1 Tax=Methylocystis heyeri TaxID=391905 RepID=A0A6B8KDS1_9HYPH|nr:class I SAM-dependent methyltransferase [Methylocystis heyeri]QGM46406.1 SAM-dependent methyltransferase [Methylocystis heyeri]